MNDVVGLFIFYRLFVDGIQRFPIFGVHQFKKRVVGSVERIRADFEYPEAPNGCLSCHAETYRTERHNVSYLNAKAIEEIGRAGSSDSCYGCHGGRSWYRISYPYPRHAWPEMFDEEVPEWAVGRPTESEPEYALPGAE